MASPLTILKIVLNLNHKCMQITGCDEKTVTVHRFGEAYKQTRIYAYAKPYKRFQSRCPVCRQRCPGYDTKHDEESTWRTYIIKKFKKGETSHETHAQDLKDLAFNPLNPQEMVTATKERVYLTRDGGLNWTNIGSASLRTNGIKAVAVASMKTAMPGQNETVVFMAHSILGFWYYKPDSAKPDWLDANRGLECSDPNNSSDEVSDILPVVAQDGDKNQWCEIFLAQTFMPRIYHFDLDAQRSACIYKGTEPCDTIDSLWQNGNTISFIAPGKVGSFDMTTNTASELNASLKDYIAEFTKSKELVNAAWIPAENARGLKINGGVLLNELWLLDSGKILSPYAAKIDGQKSLYVPAYQAHLPGGFEKFKKLIYFGNSIFLI